MRVRVSRARGNLPPDTDPPTVERADAEGRPIIWIRVTSDTRDVLELTELAETLFTGQVAT